MKKLLILAIIAMSSLGVSAYQLKRVSVHDPSIVWEPTSQTYYIFGSHRASAKSKDLMSWTSFTAPWQTATSNNASNASAFTTPQVTKVRKGGVEVDLPIFDAVAWSARGGNGYNVNGNMWAPDVIWNKVMQKWCMYLSINGSDWYSSIIMLTADNIEGPYRYQAPVVISGFKKGTEYKNTDLELVIGTQSTLPNRYAEPWASTGKASMPNNIDPCVFYDEEGHLWMSYGSWSGGIFMLELDETTGLRDYDVTYPLSTNSDPYFGKRIAGGYYVSGEASYIEYIGGYYYLFVSYGGLAAGGNPDDYNNGGYQMRVFRSDKPDGPYKDARGNDAVYSSFTVNFGTSDTSNRGINIFGAYGEWGNQANGNYGERSQGHNSIIAAEAGRTYLVYHTRFQNAGESHQVRVHQVFQNAKGWLVVAPFEYTGETVTSADVANSQQVSTNRIAGTYQLLIHRYKLDHTKKEQATPVEIQLNADGTISGALSGNWTIHEGTSYIDIKLGSVTYQGVMVEQTLEPTTTTTIAFTAVSTSGVSVWGYQTEKASVIHKMNADALNIETPVYDLSGRYVSSINRRGIYIQKGRKLLTR